MARRKGTARNKKAPAARLAPAPAPCYIGRLAPEELHLIFQYCGSRDNFLQSYLHEMGHLALVCKAWVEPIQRLAFKCVVITSARDLVTFTKLAKEKDYLGGYVCEINVRMLHLSKREPCWTGGQLNDLLNAAPNATSLTLAFDWNKAAECRALNTFPNLTHLMLFGSDEKAEMLFPHQILSCTPNLVSLFVTPFNNLNPQLSSTRNRTPLALPHLTKLCLPNFYSSSHLHSRQLLDDATLGRIKMLEVYGDEEESSESNANFQLACSTFFEKVGKNVQSLQVFAFSPNNSLLAACPQVKTLRVSGFEEGVSIPISVRKVITTNSVYSWMEEGYVGWGNVKVIELLWGNATEEEMAPLVAKGIKVIQYSG